MSRKKINIYDTTLRDGAQTEGMSLSVEDKLIITEKLDGLGVSYIEGGWPGANPRETEYFKQMKKVKLKTAELAAFGCTRRKNTKAKDDQQILNLVESGAPVVTIFGKTWDLHVKEALRVSFEENLRMIEDSMAFLKKKGKTAFYDAEHFFDGYRSNPEYAIKTLEAAQNGGADTIILCDTNGGSLPNFIQDVIAKLQERISVPLGIHCHNDMNLGVANALAAVEAGCTQVQGTINGYGERCGNSNLCSVIPILQLKQKYNCVPSAKLKTLTKVSNFVTQVTNMQPSEQQPFVGPSAFAHKGGIHINAVLKNPETYEHIEPEALGNSRKLLVSEMGGRTTIQKRAHNLGLEIDDVAAESKKVLEVVQEKEKQGYTYEMAEQSFEMLLRRSYKKFKEYFSLEGFRVVVEKREDGNVSSEATIKVKVGETVEHTAANGDGPVHALDQAMRKALRGFYPKLKDLRLIDFKVRDLQSQANTAAKVRVLIESRDASGSWWTIGVSENIIEASWQALVDSVEYKLLKDKVSSKAK